MGQSTGTGGGGRSEKASMYGLIDGNREGILTPRVHAQFVDCAETKSKVVPKNNNALAGEDGPVQCSGHDITNFYKTLK